MKKIILTLVVLFTTLNYAQIDTTTFYPMHIGDKWEYYSFSSGYRQVEILGDTLMPNNKTYFIIDIYADYKYQRIDSNNCVRTYYDYKKDDSIVYDLEANKGEIFLAPPTEHTWGYGVYNTGNHDNNVLGIDLEWKEYRPVYIDSSVIPIDTIWYEEVDWYPLRITKGLGVSSYAYGIEILVGAYINGVGYGTLVDVQEQPEIIADFKLHQNYPNPFNPVTTIRYSVPKHSQIKIEVYNTLGEKVKTLFDGTRKMGKYSVTFNGSKLPSGTYLICLTSGENHKTIKALLLK